MVSKQTKPVRNAIFMQHEEMLFNDSLILARLQTRSTAHTFWRTLAQDAPSRQQHKNAVLSDIK